MRKLVPLAIPFFVVIKKSQNGNSYFEENRRLNGLKGLKINFVDNHVGKDYFSQVMNTLKK